MKTARVEISVVPKGTSVVFQAKNKGDDTPISITLSPVRAFSFYQVLMGRKSSEVSKREEEGRLIFFSIFSEKVKQEDGDGQESITETGYKIIHLKEEDGDNKRRFGYSVGAPGQLLLAEEFRSAISSVLKDGGGIEVSKDKVSYMLFNGKMRVIVDGDIVRLREKTITILKNLLLAGRDADLGEVVVKKGKFFIKGTQLTPEQEAIFRGLVEVLSL